MTSGDLAGAVIGSMLIIGLVIAGIVFFLYKNRKDNGMELCSAECCE